jgi:hypothetical protein
VSYERFAKGDTLQAIAMQQPSGKPVQASTIQVHIMTALSFQRPVDLRRLFEQSETVLPNEQEWSKMEEAAATRGQNVDDFEFKLKEGTALGKTEVELLPECLPIALS